MTDFPVIRNAVAVADPDAPANAIKPNADGSINVVTDAGALADAAYTDSTGAAPGSAIALLKGIYVELVKIAANTTPAI